MSYPTYPEYVDSGIEWIGEIPSDWRVKPAFAVVSEQKNSNKGMVETKVLSLSYGNIVERDVASNMGLLPASFETYQVVDPGNIILRLTDLQNDKKSLRVGLVKDRGIITSAYLCLNPKSLDSRFAYYLLHNYDLRKVFYFMGAGVRQSMSFEDLRRLPCVVPSMSEQQAISTFLDRETARIDGLIGKKVRLIKLLEEKRQAVISHAVTKGLNPNTPMKDSGIDWLGQIPEHWLHNTKFSYLAKSERQSFVNGPFGSDLLSSELMETGIPVIYSGDVKVNKFIKKSKWCVSAVKAEQLNFCRVDEGDLLLSKVGDPPGLACIYPLGSPSAIVTQDVVRVKTDPQKCTALYLAYFLNSEMGKFLIKEITVSSTRGRYSLGDLKNIRLILPPVTEQVQIIEHIQNVTQKYDVGVEKAKQAINCLKEHRTSLISAAVTGKIDVRPKAEVIALSSRQKRNLVAAEIIRHMHAHRTFGRTKAQKMFYLCEAYVGLSEFQGNYERYAAGPHDPKQMNSIAAELEDLQWYRQVEEINPETGSIRYSYQPLVNASEPFDLYEQNMLSEKKKIAHLITVARNWTTQQSEIIATLYAAWNDLLLDGKTVTDALVLSEVKNNWDEKKKRIPDYKWQAGFELMRKHNLIPTGKGPHTISQAGLF